MYITSVDFENYRVWYMTYGREEKDMGEFYCDTCRTTHQGGHMCDKRLDTKLKKFWMVACFEQTRQYNDHQAAVGPGPKVRHETKEAAEKEAKKLAKGSTTLHFVVLEAMDAFVIPSPTPQRIKLGDSSAPESGGRGDWTEEG